MSDTWRGGAEEDLPETAEHSCRAVTGSHGGERSLGACVVPVGRDGERQEPAPGVLLRRAVLLPVTFFVGDVGVQAGRPRDDCCPQSLMTADGDLTGA